VVTITRGLLSVLRERAAERDPDTVNVALDASAAGDLDWTEAHGGDTPGETGGGAGASNDTLGDTPDDNHTPTGDTDELDPTTPVLTHFYLPEAAASVSAVFGMDLGRPSGAARFLSHPSGRRGITEADDLAAAVFVATPPYEESDVAVYDRRGRRQSLRIVDAVPPEESLADPFAEQADDRSAPVTDDDPAPVTDDHPSEED